MKSNNHQITIQTTKTDNGWNFEVTITEGGSETHHAVTMTNEFYTKLNTETKLEDIVRQSFEFLLERESKESILGEFEITLIGHYFPEYNEFVKTI